MPDITVLAIADWRVFREIRLFALSESPDAFLATYKEESAYDDSGWQTEFGRGDWYAGMVKTAAGDELVSIAGITREPGTPAHQCFLEFVWVAPEFRRQGVAFDMISAILERLRLAAVRTVFLWVIDGNGGAMRLYTRLGFVSCDHRQPLDEHSGRTEELLRFNFGEP